MPPECNQELMFDHQTKLTELTDSVNHLVKTTESTNKRLGVLADRLEDMSVIEEQLHGLDLRLIKLENFQWWSIKLVLGIVIVALLGLVVTHK